MNRVGLIFSEIFNWVSHPPIGESSPATRHLMQTLQIRSQSKHDGRSGMRPNDVPEVGNQRIEPPIIHQPHLI